MIIKYRSSVYTRAGWREVTITADAERVSPGVARVTSVQAIGGHPPTGTMSRTGSRRQEFHGAGIAMREVGARKRLSSCSIVEV